MGMAWASPHPQTTSPLLKKQSISFNCKITRTCGVCVHVVKLGTHGLQFEFDNCSIVDKS